MPELRLCSLCGVALSADAPRGLCPRCLFASTMSEDGDMLADPTTERVDRDGPRGPTTPEAVGSTSLMSDAIETIEYEWRNVPPLWVNPPVDRLTPARDRPPSQIADKNLFAPDYEILGRLGQGGMGIVYRARQVRANREVALKMIRGGSSVDAVQIERFRIEAQTLGRLRHHNIVQVFDVGERGGLPYFSLELLEGGSLKEKLVQAPMAPGPAALLVATLARAISAAHRLGIVHRDLKPSNVLFDLDGVPKISDFGLAKRLESEDGQTFTGQVMGTPSYMAPEQARGENREVGPRVDIYSLGAILYETLAGRPPFRGASTSETIRMVIDEDPVRPTQLRPRVPRDLETICLKCLQKDPSRRYPTADELADDLERFLDGRPIRARRAPPWEHAAKWARRRPTTSTLAAVGLAAAVAVAVVALNFRQKAVAEEGRIEGLRSSVDAELIRARELLAARKPDEAGSTLRLARTIIDSEATLSDLRPEADRLSGGIKGLTRDLERLDSFRAKRDEAMSLSVRFVEQGRDQADQIRSTRRVAAEARSLFSTESARRPGGGSPSLTPEESAEIEEGTDLLGMILAEGIASPLPGEDATVQARSALSILDGFPGPRREDPAYHLLRGDILGRLGDEGAASERELGGQLRPARAYDHLLLGLLRFRRHEWDPARGHFEEALRLESGLFWARCLLAVSQLNSSPPRAAEARVELGICIDSKPGYGWLFTLRGTACTSVGLALLSAGRVGRPDTRAEAASRFREAESDFARAWELLPATEAGKNDRYQLLMSRGVMRLLRDQAAEAADDFARAAELDGRHYNAHKALGQALGKLDRVDEAIGALDRAIAIEPGLATLYRERGRLLEKGGRPVESLRDFEESARREPPSRRLQAADDHLRRARILFRLGRYGEAVAAADDALRLAPALEAAHRVKLESLLKLDRYAEAVDAADAAAARVGSSSYLLYQCRGLGRLKGGDFGGAVEDLSQALRLEPRAGAEIRRLRGWAYLFADSARFALADFDAAIKLEPLHPDGYAGRAAARVALDAIPEAIQDVGESLRLGGDSGYRYHYLAAKVYAQAATRLAADRARRGRIALIESAGHRRSAVRSLALALDRIPARDRAAFARENLANDKNLGPLLADPRLASRLGGPDAR